VPTIADRGHDLPRSTRTPTRYHHHARRARERGNGLAESLTLDISAAADLFAWTYRRSIEKYAVQIQAAGLPDLFRATHRDAINELVSRVVRERHSLGKAVAEFDLPAQDAEKLTELVKGDIDRLGEHNFARYRLTLRELMHWVDAGRPVTE
jgi:hypothetical protein